MAGTKKVAIFSSQERGSTLFSSKVCAITRECEHIRPQFSGPKAFVDLTTQPATYPHLLFKEADYSDLKTKYIYNYFVIWAQKWSCTASSLLTRILCPRQYLLKFRGKCLKRTIEETNFRPIFFQIRHFYMVSGYKKICSGWKSYPKFAMPWIYTVYYLHLPPTSLPSRRSSRSFMLSSAAAAAYVQFSLAYMNKRVKFIFSF